MMVMPVPEINADRHHLRILGTRGIPAQHGGFETFAERLALYLVFKGWSVTVYCQDEGQGKTYQDRWNGVDLVHIPINRAGASGTIIFDWLSTLHAARSNDAVLTLGYNTAIFCFLYRVKKITNLINMDGIEWRREKWSLLEKVWLFINERLGSLLGNHLVADNPGIQEHLAGFAEERKITMIPYGSDRVEHADTEKLQAYGLEVDRYSLVVARPEPENSILEMVQAFSRRPRGIKLVVLGKFEPKIFPYHKVVMAAASDEVLFPGAIYDQSVVAALRKNCCLYMHGHTVGGTNPSLVEALGAGSPILAHDNKFNRWVAGEDASYFHQEEDCCAKLDLLLGNKQLLASMRVESYRLHQERFEWPHVLEQYEQLLLKFV